MGEPTAETITPPQEPTTQTPEIGKPSLVQKFKSILSSLGKGAESAEKVAPYHLPEQPTMPKKDPPPQGLPSSS